MKNQLLIIFLLIPFIFGLPAESKPLISCGQTITQDTILAEDLACPPGTESAIVIGASTSPWTWAGTGSQVTLLEQVCLPKVGQA